MTKEGLELLYNEQRVRKNLSEYIDGYGLQIIPLGSPLSKNGVKSGSALKPINNKWKTDYETLFDESSLKHKPNLGIPLGQNNYIIGLSFRKTSGINEHKWKGIIPKSIDDKLFQTATISEADYSGYHDEHVPIRWVHLIKYNSEEFPDGIESIAELMEGVSLLGNGDYVPTAPSFIPEWDNRSQKYRKKKEFNFTSLYGKIQTLTRQEILSIIQAFGKELAPVRQQKTSTPNTGYSFVDDYKPIVADFISKKCTLGYGKRTIVRDFAKACQEYCKSFEKDVHYDRIGDLVHEVCGTKVKRKRARVGGRPEWVYDGISFC